MLSETAFKRICFIVNSEFSHALFIKHNNGIWIEHTLGFWLVKSQIIPLIYSSIFGFLYIWSSPLKMCDILWLSARKAVEYGVAGIVVSNHGARQLDYTPATISVLEEASVPFDQNHAYQHKSYSFISLSKISFHRS